MNSDHLPEGVDSLEILGIYLESGRECLESIRQSLNAIEEEHSEVDLASIHRKSHNLKGASWQLGLSEPGKIAECMEKLAASLLNERRPAGPEELSALLEGTVSLDHVLKAIASGETIPDADDACARLDACRGGSR